MKSKFLIYIVVGVGVLFFSCKLDDSSVKATFYLNLISWNLPDTVNVSTDFDIYVKSALDNSCTRDLRFVVEKYDDITYKVYARAIYENHGESCDSVLVYKDSTIKAKFANKGKYYFLFLNENIFKADSIVIK